MPFAAVNDREVEFGPLGTAESDPDLNIAAPQAVGNRMTSRLAGVAMLSVLLVGALRLGGSPPREAQADTEFLISESHFSQSCSWKCNDKFWGKGHVAQSAQRDYQSCCQSCPGNVCIFPCTDACRQQREKQHGKCSGNATCMDGAQKEHKKCCSKCPGSVCVAQESEEVGELASSAKGDASAEPPAAADGSIEPAAMEDPLAAVGEPVGPAASESPPGEASSAHAVTAASIEPAAVEEAFGGGAAAPPAVGVAPAAERVRETCGGNAAGAACKFPFEYAGEQYTACTSVDNGQPWCYTAVAGQWGNCNCPPS